MVGEAVDGSDLRLVDVLCAQRLDALRALAADDHDAFAALAVDETFVAQATDGGVVELCRNGAQVAPRVLSWGDF